MVAVSSHGCVVESHLQFIHGFKQQALCLIVKVLKRCLLGKEQGKNKIYQQGQSKSFTMSTKCNLTVRNQINNNKIVVVCIVFVVSPL